MFGRIFKSVRKTTLKSDLKRFIKKQEQIRSKVPADKLVLFDVMDTPRIVAIKIVNDINGQSVRYIKSDFETLTHCELGRILNEHKDEWPDQFEFDYDQFLEPAKDIVNRTKVANGD